MFFVSILILFSLFFIAPIGDCFRVENSGLFSRGKPAEIESRYSAQWIHDGDKISAKFCQDKSRLLTLAAVVNHNECEPGANGIEKLRQLLSLAAPQFSGHIQTTT